MSEEKLIKAEINDTIAFTQDQLDKAQYLIDSKLLPEAIKTPQQALIIIQKGKELGFKEMHSFDAIDVIMGKACLKPKYKGSLARQSGIVRWRTIKDWEPTVDESGAITNYVTEILIERKYDDGWYPDTSTFTWTEANTMGYLNKPNWRSQPNVMAKWRCLSRGLDQVCPDLTGGLYMSDEIADTYNVNYKMDSEGNFEVIN